MYLRTPKRYQNRGRRRNLLNLKWLWLYLIAPFIIIPAALAFQYRDQISQAISKSLEKVVPVNFNPPTPTATLPVADLQRIFSDSVQSGKIENALSALYGLADNAPNDVNLHVMLARMTLLRGDQTDVNTKKEALQAAAEAVNANPEAGEGYIMVALAYTKSDDPRRALSYALRALDFLPDDPLLQAVLGEIYSDLDQYELATAAADKAIELASNTKPLNTLALAYANWVKGLILSTSSGQAAQESYEEAYRVAVTDASMPLGFFAQPLYFIYITQNRVSDLVQMFTLAAERDKDDEMNPYYLGLLYIRDQNWDRARPYFQQCLDLNPKNVRCLRRIAYVYYNQDAMVPAADFALRAIDAGTTEPQAYLLAGLALIEQPTRRCSEAVPLLQKGYIMTQESQELSDQDKGVIMSQIESGLSSCNARPVDPTPTVLPTPTA
ncbi:MAG: tetratricopeptide repeat protein [Anaerolineae bacterium]|nr:tetratricopeptide repeat protein [Anaerolineae bacterium]